MISNRRFMLIVILLAIVFVGGGCGADEEPSADLLTLDIVTDAFQRGGLQLEINNALESLEPEDYELKGVSPTIYSLGKTEDKLLIYIFDTYFDLDTYTNEETGVLREIPDILFRRGSFLARNALILYLPSTIPEITDQTAVSSQEGRQSLFQQEMKRLVQTSNTISDIVFEQLNDGKVATFLGESENWRGRITMKYWQHHWVNQDGLNKYSGDYTQHHEIKYLSKDISEVGSVSYEYEGSRHSGGVTGITLDSKGYSSAGSDRSRGWISKHPDKDIYHVTVKWEGQEESFVLTPWEPMVVVDFR